MTIQRSQASDSVSIAGQELLRAFLGAAGIGHEDRSSAEPRRIDPSATAIAEAQLRCVLEYQALWAEMLSRGPRGHDSASGSDRRFSGKAWRDSRFHDYLRRSYAINASFLADCVEALDLDALEKRRLRFVVRQLIDAMSPANFAATNPDAIQRAIETQGRSVMNGLANLANDLHRGRVSTNDENAFEIGRNLATSPGAVVHENALMQLIQYAPTTPRVRARPLLIVPPCINKYYVLDLQPGNSFIRYAVERGNTVFMVSWRNVTDAQGHFTWEDYLSDGVVEAMRTVRTITGNGRINAIGYCVGGTMLGAVLAALAARGDDWVESVTFLTALHDFAEAGELRCFIDEIGVAAREAAIGRGGVMPGRELALAFSSLRANDLVWNYVVSGYLKGDAPPAFDLLYWNADSTNLPGPMYCWYIRNMYLENNLREPGRLAALGVPVDLGRITLPTYVLATREDHIVPWKSAYRTTQLMRGESRFVLGASGHIAGVINPAWANRRSYVTADVLPDDANGWLASAHEVKGSWWPDWDAWLAPHSGGEVASRQTLGGGGFAPIEAAPGRYVRQPAK